jgi:2-isopropylmalate synthase
MVQGTINGYGERCGNANLVSIIPSLTLKMGYRTVTPERLAELTALSVFVAETANLQPDAWAPYVGHNAFAHKGGMHQQGVNADARAYEHIEPAAVGNERRVLVSELSGRGTILAKARELGVDLDDERGRVPAILARLKELEHRGYHFEVADGSFELLLERETGVYEPLFTLESFRVITEKRADGRVETEATVKLFHRGERLVATAEGNGPVNALDAALRLALEPRVPELAAISLVNFKVRILDETKGTGAVTRVLIDSGDGRDTWGAIGVSENIIEASWEALLDSLEHGVRRSARAPASTSTG